VSLKGREGGRRAGGKEGRISRKDIKEGRKELRKDIKEGHQGRKEEVIQ
jgi:hypothetical protein